MDARPSSTLWLAVSLAFSVTSGPHDPEQNTLTLLNKDACQARQWREGEVLNVVLPIQSGTAYLWDLDKATRVNAPADEPSPVRLLGSFDDPTVRDMTRAEQDAYRPEDGGPLGGFDRMQTVRVRLERAGTLRLIFRKFRAFDRRPSDREADRFTVRLRVVAAS